MRYGKAVKIDITFDSVLFSAIFFESKNYDSHLNKSISSLQLSRSDSRFRKKLTHKNKWNEQYSIQNDCSQNSFIFDHIVKISIQDHMSYNRSSHSFFCCWNYIVKIDRLTVTGNLFELSLPVWKQLTLGLISEIFRMNLRWITLIVQTCVRNHF